MLFGRMPNLWWYETKVLIACEFSGIVRDEFRKRGHDAYSCDLIDSEIPSQYHIKDDVLQQIHKGWDLMIAHPPCTHLAVSGAKIGRASVGKECRSRWSPYH